MLAEMFGFKQYLNHSYLILITKKSRNISGLFYEFDLLKNFCNTKDKVMVKSAPIKFNHK